MKTIPEKEIFHNNLKVKLKKSHLISAIYFITFWMTKFSRLSRRVCYRKSLEENNTVKFREEVYIFLFLDHETSFVVSHG